MDSAGRTPHCFARLEESFPAMRSIHLLKNYRSTPEILRCALPVISENEGLQRLLEAQHPSGALVRCVTAESDLSEGIYIAKEINRMVGGIDMLDSDAGFSHAEDAPPRSFSDIAVLYRTHRQADLVEKCSRRRGIPCVIAGRDDFLADDAVRGAVSFFHFLLDVQNDPALRACLKLVWNCPADLIGSLAQFFAQAASGNPSQEALDAAATEYADVAVLQPFFAQVEEFRQRVGKEKPRKLLDAWAKAQGLTASETFPAPAEHSGIPQRHGLFPAKLTSRPGKRLDAKRNRKTLRSGRGHPDDPARPPRAWNSLWFPRRRPAGKKSLWSPPSIRQMWKRNAVYFYVGMTRAQDELILLTSNEPSCFLDAIPADCLHKTTTGGKKRASEMKQLSLFD